MLKRLKSLFKKNNKDLLEEKLSEQIILEDQQRLEEARQNELPATVIMYLSDERDDSIPRMDVLVDDFQCRMLPELGSIIWIEMENYLRPFSVQRFDYIQNSSEYDSIRVYIVVHPASRSMIMPKPYYGINE